MGKISLLAEINSSLSNKDLSTYAIWVLKHPLNEVKINPRGSREAILMALKKVPLEILKEVFDEIFENQEEEDCIETLSDPSYSDFEEDEEVDDENDDDEDLSDEEE